MDRKEARSILRQVFETLTKRQLKRIHYHLIKKTPLCKDAFVGYVDSASDTVGFCPAMMASTIRPVEYFVEGVTDNSVFGLRVKRVPNAAYHLFKKLWFVTIVRTQAALNVATVADIKHSMWVVLRKRKIVNSNSKISS